MKIILEKANNGVIKKIIDDNYGGGNEKYSVIELYEENKNYEYIKRFLYELCEDLCINIGNQHNSEMLQFKIDWGINYEPTNEEINKKIKKLEAEIAFLKEWKK